MRLASLAERSATPAAAARSDLLALPQLDTLLERCTATEAAAVRAEEVASAAMAAAEGAVRDEMEAAAVAKEIASALDKALTDLQARFAGVDMGGECGTRSAMQSPWRMRPRRQRRSPACKCTVCGAAES